LGPLALGTDGAGFSPKIPLNEAGMRIEPAPSVPSARGPRPAATAAPAPPDEPPVVLLTFQGLRVIPVSGLSVTALNPNSGVVVFPIRIPPAARTLATAGASSSATYFSRVREPDMVRTPRVRSKSLIETGRP